MAEVLGEIAGTLWAIKDLIGDVWDALTEQKDVIVEGGTQVIGLADAVKEPVEISTGFLGSVFPTEVVVMFGIAFTVIIALAMRRSTNA